MREKEKRMERKQAIRAT